MSPPTVSPKRCVRNWCCRRIRVAFRDALRERGYDSEGRPAHSGDGRQNFQVLRGYLRIQPKIKTITAKYVDIQHECRTVLKEVIKMCSYRHSTSGMDADHFEVPLTSFNSIRRSFETRRF